MKNVAAALSGLLITIPLHAQYADYPHRYAESVALDPTNFWHPRLETNRTKTVWHNIEQCEKTHRIDNFRIAAGEKEGHYRGLRFNDSDFHKVLEGAARILAITPDTKLEAAIDDYIDLLARAQEPNGYLYTVMQIPHSPDEEVRGVVPGERWKHERESHETYSMGHLIEAGVAHYQATGKRTLLEIATKAADCLVANLGAGKMEFPTGHQQAEIGLAALYQLTGNKQYLDLARYFIEQRGKPSKDRPRIWGTYFQDHKPVRTQDEVIGHAVRAAYLYMAMADVSVVTQDDEYQEVLRKLWDNLAGKKLYLTGGIGGGLGEEFSDAYVMPNLRGYNETCASIANILWQQRMFKLDGEAKYIDIVERCLHNSFLSGISMKGDTFFYPNRLASSRGERRQPWFSCACCPPNVVRFIPQVPDFFYAQRDQTLFVNLFGSSTARFKLPAGEVQLKQVSDYPWDGKVSLEVQCDAPLEFTLAIRQPGWLEKPFPSDLYRYDDQVPASATQRQLRVNGEATNGERSAGYERLTRTWRPGDRVELNFPMPVRRVVARSEVVSCRDRVALMRGPIVFTAEGLDNDDNVHNVVLPRDAEFKPSKRPDLLGGVVTLQGDVEALAWDEKGETINRSDHRLTLIPYYASAHRERTPMRVWLATKPDITWPTPTDMAYADARVTTSGRNTRTFGYAMHDQYLPISSSDLETPRFAWNQTKQPPVDAGPLEGAFAELDLSDGVLWIQYDFDEPVNCSRVGVYWSIADHGRVVLPQAFRVLYRADDQWHPIPTPCPRPRADELQTITFTPVTTQSIRMEVVPTKGKSAGLLEWVVR